MAGRDWRLTACISMVMLIALTSALTAEAATLMDTTGRQVDLAATPQRIVALIPSAVETLFDLRVGPAVVGRGPSAAVYPLEAEALPVVDSLETIIRLRPDLIVSHPNHHRFSPQMLEQPTIPLLLLQHQSVAEVLANIVLLGTATGRASEAEALLGPLQEQIRSLTEEPAGSRPRVLLLFGTPRSFLAMSEDTHAGDLLRLAGGQNVASQLPRLYAGGGLHPLSLELIVQSRPEWVLVITHGDPQRVTEAYHKEIEGHPAWWQLPAVHLCQVRVLPDDLFASSPGPRLDQALAHLRRLLSTEPTRVRCEGSDLPLSPAPSSLALASTGDLDRCWHLTSRRHHHRRGCGSGINSPA
jgi:iron complex transport system substrate-binding protein